MSQTDINDQADDDPPSPTRAKIARWPHVLISIASASVAAWLLFGSGDFWVAQSFGPWVYPILLFALGLTTGISISAGVRTGAVAPMKVRRVDLAHILGSLVAVVIVAAASILAGHSYPDAQSGLKSAVVLFLGSGAIIGLIALLASVAAGDRVALESHWGGLGGSLGGWQVSWPIICVLLIFACFGGMVAVVAGSPSLTKNAAGTVQPPGDRPDQADENAATGRTINSDEPGNVVSDPNANKITNDLSE